MGRRAALLTCTLLLLGCEKQRAPDVSSAPSATGDRKTAAATSPAGSDKDLLNRSQDAMGKQIEADARAGATRTFKSEDESASSSVRWATDPTIALADAKRRHRATLIFFSAEWDTSSKELERNFADASVRKTIDERFVAARVDMTDGDAPETRKHEQTFRIAGIPTLLVFDRDGREVGRQGGFVDIGGLQSLLARVK